MKLTCNNLNLHRGKGYWGVLEQIPCCRGGMNYFLELHNAVMTPNIGQT